MRLGLVLPVSTGDARRAVAVARAADDAGIDGVFVPDHLGRPETRPPLEAFTLLGAVASVTRHALVGPLVARASARPPAALAKLAASIETLSAGRSVLGLGAGDAATAHEDLAAPHAFADQGQRRAHLAEVVAAVRALLGGRSWEGGDLVPALEGPILPRPDRVPPIWIGGASADLARLAATVDAWNGWGLPEDRFLERAATYRAEGGREATWGGVVLIGRDDDEVQRRLVERRGRGLPSPDWSGTPDSFARWSRHLEDHGVTWITVGAAGGDATIAPLLDDVIPRMRT